MKICKKCGKEKPLGDFYKNKGMKDGCVNKCKACDSAYWKARRTDPVTGAVIRKRKNEHQIHMYNTDSAYRLKILNQGKESAKRNRERVRKYHQEWNQRPEVKERTRELQRALYARNPVKAKERCRKKYKKRMSNPVYRINNATHVGLSKSIKNTKAGRKWQALVGYTLAELIDHLVLQFTEGMSLENYGKWHIDHKIPCSFFVFDSPEDVEFRMCWRLENLQPLWAEDNMRKGNKILQVA